MLKLVDIRSPVKGNLSASQKVSRKYRKAYMRKLKAREFSKLRAIIPATAKKEKVSKVTVVEEAIKYIDELHQSLTLKLQARGLFREEINQRTIFDFVRNMAPFNLTAPPMYEKQQLIPSYQKTTERRLKGKS